MRASIAAERAGVPTVSLVARAFESQARAVTQSLGFSNFPLAVYPGDVRVDDESEFRRKVETVVVDEIAHGFTQGAPKVEAAAVEPEPRHIVVRGSLDHIQDHFVANQWTDGLPVIPPTLAAVDRFMEATDRPPDEVLGLLNPAKRQMTVWNVAVTGVMAGCQPEYMPVLVAIAEAIADPMFRVGDAGSLSGWEPLIVASGPIRQRLDLNSGTGVLRMGRRSNTTIGRFLRLLLCNLAGQRIPPGDTDKAAIGSPFNVVLAEDEETVAEIGWPTFGEDRGVPRDQSAVTVQSVVAESPPLGEFDGPSDDVQAYLKPLVEVFGRAICGYYVFTGLAWGRWHPLIVISPYLARLLARRGWDKDDVRRYLFENAKIPAGEIENRGRYVNLDVAEQVRRGMIPPVFAESSDPHRLIPTFVKPEWISIVVAGNPESFWQRGYMNNHAQGAPVTRIVRPVPPAAG